MFPVKVMSKKCSSNYEKQYLKYSNIKKIVLVCPITFELLKTAYYKYKMLYCLKSKVVLC